MRKRKWFIVLSLLCLAFMPLYSLTLFTDSFDSNPALAGWKRSSSTYVTRITNGYIIGSAALRVNGPYYAETYVNTQPFKNIKLSYRLAASSLLSGNTLEVWADYGTGYVRLSYIDSTKANGTYYSFTNAIPNGSSSFKFKFILKTTSTGCYGYIDSIVLTGDR